MSYSLKHGTSYLVCLCLVAVGSLCLAWPKFAMAQAKPAWQQRWEKVLSEAQKEGKVVVYGPPGEAIRNVITEGFKKAFPEILIEYSGGRGTEQAAKISAERAGGIYSVDVVLAGTSTVNIQLKPIGILDPIKPALILPEVTDPKHWKDNQLQFSDTGGTYNLVFINILWPLVGYNLKEVRADEIDELHELLEPKWRGKILINDPLVTGAGHVTFRWIWRVLGPEKATEYYRKIRAQAGAVDRDQRRQIEWIAQGKYAILLSPGGTPFELLKRGLKFGMFAEFKDYGGFVTASFGSAGLLNKAPHPNAATVFLNWFLGKEGQTLWSRATGEASRRLDVSTDHLAPYIVPKSGAKYFVGAPKPGERYWLSHSEENIHRSAEEESILKELFGR